MPSLTRMSCLEGDSAPCSALPLGSRRAASVKRCKAEAFERCEGGRPR